MIDENQHEFPSIIEGSSAQLPEETASPTTPGIEKQYGDINQDELQQTIEKTRQAITAEASSEETTHSDRAALTPREMEAKMIGAMNSINSSSEKEEMAPISYTQPKQKGILNAIRLLFSSFKRRIAQMFMIRSSQRH